MTWAYQTPEHEEGLNMKIQKKKHINYLAAAGLI